MEQVHESRIDQVIKPAIETLVYHIRKKKLIYFGQKIELVYENCEILRYKVGRMEEYLRIEILRRISQVLLFARKVLAIL